LTKIASEFVYARYGGTSLTENERGGRLVVDPRAAITTRPDAHGLTRVLRVV
jgi:hypothetical protein